MTEASARSVSLAIPPKPDYIVLARLALSAICRLTPLQPDDVADLKLAVTEVATERLAGTPEGSVRLAFALEDDRLVVDLHAGSSPAGGEDAALSRAIVEATVDEVTYNDSSVRLVKRLPDSRTEPEA
ncbi:MAG: ATP-binding protein [Actinomycetota bacterium]|nr:ATP-binding protein [Actinomycetota bacterium]